MKKAQEQRQKTNAGVIRREVREKIAQWLMDPAQAVRSHDLHALLKCIRMTIDRGSAFLAENGFQDEED